MVVFTHIAQLFTYPGGDYKNVIGELFHELNGFRDSFAHEFFTVANHFTHKPLPELQEYYVRTFDVNASCFLDVGYVLFGEESKRGQFLLHMQNEQRKAENDCGSEFPDHLPNMLTLLPRIREPLFREELVVTMLLPALNHMIENFRTEDNIYRNLLKILVAILEGEYTGSEFQPYKINQKEIECSGVFACGMDFTKLSNRKY